MGVNRNFYKLQSFFFPKKWWNLFLNEISNFLPFFGVVTSSGHKMKYAWELRWLNRYVRVFHDAVTMRDIMNTLKQ